ncbi:MAG: MFS transporter [Oscillospiraceae bacterium]|nr:MFS transporter [Oscillospiraceae bacterium]
MDPKFKRLKYACYSSNVSMSVAGNLSPILFLTFKEMYDISYSLLGLLILVNFVTQLGIDLVFSFFSHRFNISKTVKTMPIITIVGLLIYALWPSVFPNSVYLGLLIGTVVFSVSAGLGEVLISPVIAAIPAKEPEREMSKLHSVYAWGVVFVIILSTLFLLIFGSENWQYLALLFALVPLTSAILFAGADVPQMKTPEKASGAVKFLKSKTLWLCVIAIFLGGASELVMAQWSSGYLERALGIPKVWGDIFGVALFAAMLGLGRTLYSKIGKNIYRVLSLGALGAAVCYVTAAVTDVAVLGLLACAFTGFCVSMLWPGSLVVASDRFKSGGVFIFAMMAAGGDLGASVVPQLVGIVTDAVSASSTMSKFADSLALAPDQLGMKLGLLVGALFPLAAVFVFLRLSKTNK